MDDHGNYKNIQLLFIINVIFFGSINCILFIKIKLNFLIDIFEI